METITEFRMPDGSVMRLVDWVDKPVFSVVELFNGFTDAKIDAFTYNVSDEVPATGNITTMRVASEADTNVNVGGSNASTEEILVYAIKPEFFELQLAAQSTDATTAAVRSGGQPQPRTSVLAILNDALIMRLKITQKSYTDAGIGYYNPGFGAMSTGNLNFGPAALLPRSYANSGLPSQEAVRSFVVPHHIGGTEKYHVALHKFRDGAVTFFDEAAAPAALTAVLMRCRIYLDGMIKRPTA